MATFMLMPNYTIETRRFDLPGFLLLAIGMAVLTLALDGSKAWGSRPDISRTCCGRRGSHSALSLPCQKLRRVIQPAIVPHAHVFTGVAGQFCRAYRQRYAAVYDAGIFTNWSWFSPFHAGLMMIPMVLGSMGMKRIVVQIVNRFGYRRVLVATTLGLALVSLLFMSVALLGWYYLLPLVLLLQEW